MPFVPPCMFICVRKCLLEKHGKELEREEGRQR